MSAITADQATGELRRLHEGWTAAVGATKDYDFLHRHIGDGWLYTDFNGVRRGKDEYLKLVDSLVSYTQEVREFDVRVAGGVAIVTGVYRAHAEIKGVPAPLDNIIAFSAIWERRDGVWRALLHHTTRIADAP